MSAELRTQIAWDVITGIKTRRLTAVEGDYLHVLGCEGELDRNQDARRLLSERKCHVCAKGALLVAAIDRLDKVKFDDLLGDDDYSSFPHVEIGGDTASMRWLSQTFERDQLILMEAAFERTCIEDVEDEDLFERCSRAVDFGEGFYDPEERLLAIMHNVVYNGGEFVP